METRNYPNLRYFPTEMTEDFWMVRKTSLNESNENPLSRIRFESTPLLSRPDMPTCVREESQRALMSEWVVG